MATIALTGNTIGCSLGIGSFESLGKAFLNSKNSTGGLSGALSSLKNKIDIASIAVKADTSQQQVKQAGSRETEKKGSLTLAYDKLDTLVYDVGVVDCLVSGKVNRRKDDFYKRYSYLKPECEKSNKEKLADFGRSVWNGICSVKKAIGNFIKDVAEWCKDHWKELLIGLAFIVVGALITVFTAGAGTAFWAAFGTALVKGIATAVIAGMIAGTLNAGITYGVARLSGASHDEAMSLTQKAFGDGFASGFMMGGIGFAGGAFGSGFGTTYKMFRAIQYTSKISGVISISMFGFDIVSQVAGLFNENSFLYSLNKSLHNNNIYNGFQKIITGIAVFSGSAYSKAEITDGTHMYQNENGDMVPRDHVKYSTGEDGVKYHYVTGRKGENGAGLIKEGYAEKLELKEDGRTRYTNDKNTPGKLPGDDAGHVFGDRFKGSRRLDNETSQSKAINRNWKGEYTYKTLEDKWAKTLKNNGSVTDVKIKIKYGFGSSRPESYKVTSVINGEKIKKTFENIISK